MILGGTAVTGGLAASVGVAVQSIPVFGAVLGAVSGVIVAALSVQAGAIGLVDAGKGFNLKLTWVQLSALAVPVINVAAAASLLIPYRN